MLSQEDLRQILTAIGDCEIIKPLGQSRLGAVYHIHHKKFGECVLKCFHGKLVENKKFFRRLEEKIEVASNIKYPNFPRLHKAYIRPTPCLLREFVAGETLGERLKKKIPISRVESARLMMNAASVLQAACNFGLVHKNLKPSNLILMSNGKVKVVDFLMPASVPHYFSPEHCNGISIDHRSDIYSLGIIYYQILSGRVPFLGDIETLKNFHNNAPHPDISGLPTVIKAVLDKALAKDLAQRYQNFMEFRKDLKRIVENLDADDNNDALVEKNADFSLESHKDTDQDVVLDAPEITTWLYDKEGEEGTSGESLSHRAISSLEELDEIQFCGEAHQNLVPDPKELPEGLPTLAQRALLLAMDTRNLAREGESLQFLKFSIPDNCKKAIIEHLHAVFRRECWLIEEGSISGNWNISIDLEEARRLRYFHFFEEQINQAMSELPELSTIHKTIITRMEEVDPKELLVEEEDEAQQQSQAKSAVKQTSKTEHSKSRFSRYSILDTVISIKSQEILPLLEEKHEQSAEKEKVSSDYKENDDWLNLQDSEDEGRSITSATATSLPPLPKKEIEIFIDFSNPDQTRAWRLLAKEFELQQGKHFRLKPGNKNLKKLCFIIDISALQEYQRKRAGISSVREFFQGDYDITRLDHGGMATVLKLTTKNDDTFIILRPENLWARKYFAPYLRTRKGSDNQEVVYAQIPQRSEMVVKVAFEGREEALIYESRLLSSFAEEPEISKHIIGMVQEGSFLGSSDSRDQERVGYYLMLEYASEGNVEQFSERFPEKRLPPGIALCFLYSMVSTLQHLKSKGIIHRDIKPQNVLISKDITAKLSDFGLAITVDEASDQLSEERRRLLRLVDQEFLQISREKEQSEARLAKLQQKTKKLNYDDEEKFDKISLEIIELQTKINDLVRQEQARADGLKERYRPMSAEEIALKGEFAGSLIYAAPEQFSPSKVLTNQCDVYQLGAVAYTMLTGKRPVLGSNVRAVMGKILFAQKPQVSDVIKDSPAVDAISDLIFSMMKNDPIQRIQLDQIQVRMEEILLKHFPELSADLLYPPPQEIATKSQRVKWSEQIEYAQNVHKTCVAYLEEIYKKALTAKEKREQEKKEREKRAQERLKTMRKTPTGVGSGEERIMTINRTEDPPKPIYVWWEKECEDQAFRFRCPQCVRKLKLTYDKVGKITRCPNCQCRIIAKKVDTRPKKEK